MTNKQLIDKTAAYAKQTLSQDSSGHDWWHVYRVWQAAKAIQKTEGGNKLIIELGALLHDIADFKFHGGDLKAGARVSREWLENLQVPENTIQAICHIVENVSFKGAKVKNGMQSLEGKIVQDADRLDALGAIGIARVFAYGGKTNRPMHEPGSQPTLHDTFEAYKSTNNTAINHFYEKLLLLKDKLNTKTAKEIALHRHTFMEQYLGEFYAEWEGKR